MFILCCTHEKYLKVLKKRFFKTYINTCKERDTHMTNKAMKWKEKKTRMRKSYCKGWLLEERKEQLTFSAIVDCNLFV